MVSSSSSAASAAASDGGGALGLRSLDGGAPHETHQARRASQPRCDSSNPLPRPPLRSGPAPTGTRCGARRRVRARPREQAGTAGRVGGPDPSATLLQPAPLPGAGPVPRPERLPSRARFSGTWACERRRWSPAPPAALLGRRPSRKGRALTPCPQRPTRRRLKKHSRSLGLQVQH